MALAQTELPELKRFTFFVSRRFEEGRERFRLHIGYFATLAEAEEWLSVVREIYPGAWAGEAPGRKLRERAAAAAAAAQYAAGPQPQAPPAAAQRHHAPPPASAPIAAAPAAPPLRVPVVHAAPPVAPRAALPLAVPPIARPAAHPLTLSAASAVRPQLSAGIRRTPPAAAPLARAPQKAAPADNTRPAAPPRARGAATHAAAPAHGGKPAMRPVFEDSNVREVLKALAETSATGETRLMHAPPPPREVAAGSGALSDTQVLRLLEARRTPDSEALPELAHGGIPLLKPDDTGTLRALKEAVASNAPVAFAVQLQWSVQAVELDKVPPLAIFSAYTLYTVEGSREGRKWYGLRLGFFTDAISAKQVAYYVRSEFTSVAVVPVSPQEKARATEQDQAATLAAPATPRERTDEFKLIDEDSAARAVLPSAAAKPAAKPMPRVAVGRALRRADAPARARVRGGGKLGARDRRGPQTLEETLEILGASELSIDTGSGESLNESGVRHLRVEVQKNSPFARLLERLSERIKKP